MEHTLSKITERVKSRFRFGTLSFIFIIAYVNFFQLIFGPENSIVGVIFTIMMSASMVRDLTATPVRHLTIQSFVLIWMAVAAYLVTALPAPWSVLINFITLFTILYAYTYEYSNHMYFPYILSYLFLVFISPVDASQLPTRMFGMLTGAVSVILYQLFMGRKRVAETARDVLTEMVDDLCNYLEYRLNNNSRQPSPAETRRRLCRLSQAVYDRRKKILCVSEASFSMIDAGRGLEHLLILMQELPEQLNDQEKALLEDIGGHLKSFRAFLHQEIPELPPLNFSDFDLTEDHRVSELFYKTFFYTRDRLMHMTDPEKRTRYHKTALSMKIRLQAALDISPVRVIYALRTASLLSFATWLVQILSLPHGKWLLFTLASVSLPYADDVPVKIKKRFLATLMGGVISVILYGLVPSPAGRTAAMMLSGYLSFYFNDYVETFTCSTIGALGGAVFMNAFGFQAVGSIFLIRMGYVLAGILIGYLVNCLFCPYSREKATKQLWKKYQTITELLTSVCRTAMTEPQLYYHLVIQAHLLEEKLTQNAFLEEWKELPELLESCREQVRRAHRTVITERTDAPVFDPGTLKTSAPYHTTG